MAIWSRLTAAIAGIGVGEAAGVALEPVLDPLKQDAWAQNTPRVLDLGTLAQLAATGLISEDAAIAEGARSGFSPDRVQRATQLVLTAAPVAELLELWRRGKIGEDLVDHGLAKARIETKYWGPIKELFYGRLDPAIIATAIQRGIMKDPGFLPVGPPTAAGKVPAFPVSPLDPIEEAKASGIDAERLFVETAIVGLPLSLQQSASAYFRGIIDIDDFRRAVSEGNTRNEWGAAALEQARQILTVGEYVERQLRGWTDRAGRLADTRKHGMSDEDSDKLFQVLGRPMNARQVFQAERRGGTYDGPLDVIEPAFLKALRESNIRPEWYNLEWAYRFTQPGVFIIRQWLRDGNDPAWAEKKLRFEGWEQDDIDKFVSAYSGSGTGAKADPHLTKAQTQLWTTTHSSYVKEEIADADAEAALAAAGVAASAVPGILALWGVERNLIRAQLSAAQIKKAYYEQVVNPATGQPWTQADALAALHARGYDDADARTLLEL